MSTLLTFILTLPATRHFRVADPSPKLNATFMFTLHPPPVSLKPLPRTFYQDHVI
jgi:hypothetical protein